MDVLTACTSPGPHPHVGGMWARSYNPVVPNFFKLVAPLTYGPLAVALHQSYNPKHYIGQQVFERIPWLP